MSDRIWNFPTISISKQLFHVPGSSIEGGFTVGGARIVSPEPGGRSMLDLQVAWQLGEWDDPVLSWIMSKMNGQVFRVRLAPTPQVYMGRIPGVPWNDNGPWNNDAEWSGDLIGSYADNSLEGTNLIKIAMGVYPLTLRPGHVVGHNNRTYMCDEIDYDGTTAIIRVTPPVREDITAGELAYFRPYFLGTINNPDTVRSTYDAINAGMIQPGQISFSEAII